MGKIPDFAPDRFSAIAIGASTGAPMILEQIVAGLPADLPVPILVAQHLPPTFTVQFAAQLDRAGPLTAVEADTGMPVLPGVIYVGRGREHLRVRGRRPADAAIEISPDPTDLLFKPSADELLRSCAELYGKRTLAIVMTGIGRDGTAGAQAVHAAGGVVLTQSEATCAVYGMPRSCDEAGVSDAQLSPDEIRRAILQLSPTCGKQTRVA